MNQAQETKTILMNARSIISNPNKWTQGVLSRDSKGKSVPYDKDDAVCFCSAGAIHRAQYLYRMKHYMSDPWKKLSDVMGGSIPEFNDNHTHEEVLAAFDRAIKSVKE